jgi:type IV pilus assembly protein PilW
MDHGRMLYPGRGASLVEVMVGVVVALVSIVAVQRVFVASETAKHHAQSDGDAQQAALFALARLSFDAANAGAGIAPAAGVLATCPVTADMAAVTRPVAVVVTDGGSADIADGLVVRYAVGNHAATPATLTAAAPSGAAFLVDSPLAFSAGDQAIAVDSLGTCARAVITSVRSAGAGLAELGHDIIAADMPAGARLVNLGPAPWVVATRYDVSAGVLRTTDLNGGDAPNPLASNVVNLKVQYGVDTDGDGVLDAWLPAADAGSAGNWSPAAVLAAPATTLARVKALRVGIIVRGEQFDRAATRPFEWVLFDCAAVDKSTCPGRLAGAIAATARGGWHYRAYETVIPLRNQIWHARG